jgi:hypothetical protein
MVFGLWEVAGGGGNEIAMCSDGKLVTNAADQHYGSHKCQPLCQVSANPDGGGRDEEDDGRGVC